MRLRGYDDYEVTLGDEIRGERASLGKRIEEVARELHIKPDLLLGIENADLGAFPNASVVAGYVRSYARYLKLDPEAVYARFCAESGFVPPAHGFAAPGETAGAGGARTGQRLSGASPFEKSRFAGVPSQSRFAARVSLGWLASATALVALVVAIGAGGYALLQNVQRVGFAPLPEAPEVGAEPPQILAAGEADVGLLRPDAEAYAADGVLAAVFAPDDAPPIQRRDGPISAIDPEEAGVFALAPPPADPRRLPPEAAAAPEAGAHAPAVSGPPAAETPPAPAPAATGLAIRVADEAWIRVRDETRAVIFEGILAPGERYDLPERVARAELRAGNAGAVYFLVDGAVHGPAGRPGSVVSRVAVAAEAIRAAFPEAPAALAAFDAPAAEATHQAAALPAPQAGAETDR